MVTSTSTVKEKNISGRCEARSGADVSDLLERILLSDASASERPASVCRAKDCSSPLALEFRLPCSRWSIVSDDINLGKMAFTLKPSWIGVKKSENVGAISYSTYRMQRWFFP